MKRIRLKVAVVSAGLTYFELAGRVNALLQPGERLSEHDFSRLVMRRLTPTPSQVLALSKVLNRSPRTLFPEVPVPVAA
jgi:hypothetical protein